MEIESFWTGLPKKAKTRKQSSLSHKTQWQFDDEKVPRTSRRQPKTKPKRQRKSGKQTTLIEPYSPCDALPEQFVSFNEADIMKMTLTADFPNDIAFFEDESPMIDDLNETPTVFEEQKLPCSPPADISRHKLMKFINSMHNYSLFHKRRRRRCVSWESFCRRELAKLQNQVRRLEGQVRVLTTKLKSLK